MKIFSTQNATETKSNLILIQILIEEIGSFFAMNKTKM